MRPLVGHGGRCASSRSGPDMDQFSTMDPLGPTDTSARHSSLPATIAMGVTSGILVTRGELQELRASFLAGIRAFVHIDDWQACGSAAIEAATCGQAYFSPRLFNAVSGLIEIQCQEDARTSIEDLLSYREIQVSYRAAIGWENKRIARELQIDETTVKTHMGRSFRKLGVKSRRELRPYRVVLRDLLPTDDPLQ